MQYCNVSEFKSIGNNPFEKYFGKVVRTRIANDDKGIAGRLSSISDKYIELTHKDGRTTLIKIDEIAFMSPVLGKDAV